MFEGIKNFFIGIRDALSQELTPDEIAIKQLLNSNSNTLTMAQIQEITGYPYRDVAYSIRTLLEKGYITREPGEGYKAK